MSRYFVPRIEKKKRENQRGKVLSAGSYSTPIPIP